VAAPVAPSEPPPAEPERVGTAGSSGHSTSPSLSELEAELANDPSAVLRNITRALPRGEREAQRLKLLEVQALVKNGQVGSARARASDYFERWPNGPDIAAIEQLTGAHPKGDATRR